MLTVTATPFSLTGPLPTGTTVLEASAGTGKTYAIAALTSRYIAEGQPIDGLLVVTFTRLATSELRNRVRARLVLTEAALEAALAGDPPAGDEVLTLLTTGTREEITRRREHITRAIADFDTATVTTIHGFCQTALAGLGMSGALDSGTTLIEDTRDLVREVTDDVYVRRFAHAGPVMTMRDARAIAEKATSDPFTRLEPPAGPEDSVPVARTAFAAAVRAELAARKRRTRTIGYDDLLALLRDAVTDRATGPMACEHLRRRYQVVLIDEFQDTDPVQWEIVRETFVGERTVVLIGDPKQAIYAFRGADVESYLEAVGSAGRHETLTTNWRSDGPVLEAHQALLGAAQLGHPSIVHRPVRPAPGRETAGLTGSPDDAALRIRWVDTTQVGLPASPPIDDVRRHIARDLAADVTRLLASGARLRRSDGRQSPVRPQDIAVLVRRNADATTVSRALRDAGVPVVVNGVGSVYRSPAAREWLRLLLGLERPGNRGRAASVALTSFIGWDAARADAADEDAWESVHARLHDWGETLRLHGVATLYDAVATQEHLAARALTLTDGDRLLADMRHIAELMHVAAIDGDMGVSTLAGWLAQQIEEAPEEGEVDESARRLESDDDAVQVLTIHRAKGLEWPVVYCPYLFATAPSKPALPCFHAGDGVRTLDVGGRDGDGFTDRQDLAHTEELGEDLRLAYVALTRARQQLVVWWGPKGANKASLNRLLWAFDHATGEVKESSSPPRKPEAVEERLGRIAERAPGCISVTRTVTADPVPWTPAPPPGVDLEVTRWARAIDHRWRRVSYSGITERAHDAVVGSEPESPPPEEEPAEPETVPAGDDPLGLRPLVLPLADIPGGADFGHLVHGVLEHVDFTAPDLTGALSDLVGAALARSRPGLGDVDTVTRGLAAAIDTPLGPLMDRRRLRDVPLGDRLSELSFELPITGGDIPGGGELTVAAMADVLREVLPQGDPVRAYADRLADPALATRARGYMIGTIDLVIRVRSEDGDRFLIADHKTNRLAPSGEAPTGWHYRPAALDRAMQDADYPLQALIYLVALHRYLRWRLPDYSPERNLGGVLYLFTRGMTGAGTPVVDGVPLGVWSWRPPAALAPALSDLIDRGAA